MVIKEDGEYPEGEKTHPDKLNINEPNSAKSRI